jgi:Bacterial PH domain
MNDWLSLLLFWALWIPAMAFVMGYLAKVRMQKPADLPVGELRHPWTTLALAITGLLLFGGFALVVLVVGPDEFGGRRQYFGFLGAFSGFAAAFFPVVLVHKREHYQVTDDGIQYQPPFRRGGFLKWSDVKRVRYSITNKWFRLDGVNGEVVRISVMLLGLPDFARVLFDHVSDGVIEPSAEPVLNATREGHPPSLWQ